MRSFLSSGAMVVNRGEASVSMSRIFLWFGRDFVAPHRMPAMGTANAGRVRDTVAYWLPETERRWVWETEPSVEFQDYDWGLSCTVA